MCDHFGCFSEADVQRFVREAVNDERERCTQLAESLKAPQEVVDAIRSGKEAK